MESSAKPLVILDLASSFVMDPKGLDRCLDVVMRAGEHDEPPSSSRLRRVYGALDRVLVAHVTCDPHVTPAFGMTQLLRRLRRLDDARVFGVATFAPVVARALLRRFGWTDIIAIEPDDTPTEADQSPLWTSALSIARRYHHSPEDIALVSEDARELTYAVAGGCGLGIHLRRDARSNGEGRLRQARSWADAADHLIHDRYLATSGLFPIATLGVCKGTR